jgi:hypothetical protein
MTSRKTDCLKEDPPVPNQDWSVISFIAPEDMVEKKNIYYINNYLVSEINQSLSAQAQHMAKFLSVQMRKKIEYQLEKLESSIDEDDKRLHKMLSDKYKEMEIDEDEFVTECRRRYEMDGEEIMDKYKIFLVKNRTRLDNEFDEAHEDVPSTRGVKVRGNYPSLKKAKDRAKQMQEFEPALHTFVAPVGKWLPLNVDADEAQEQEFFLDDLNNVMGRHLESVAAGQAEFEKRKNEQTKEAKRHARMNTKERLRAKLKDQKNAKMKAEIEEIRNAATAEGPEFSEVSGTTTIKKKKRRRKKKSASEEEAYLP